jgi:gamma-glutamyltranspeptidase/glutathione hydrolase
MYLDSLGNPISDRSKFGHLAAGVPGSVDGMVKIFEKYSRLKNWATLLQPAIDMANNGFKITEREANNLNKGQNHFIKNNSSTTAFHKANWKAGDLLIQKELGATLMAIRDLGRAGFYEGRVADHIVKEMRAGKGIISHEDLKNYTSIWRQSNNHDVQRATKLFQCRHRQVVESPLCNCLKWWNHTTLQN